MRESTISKGVVGPRVLKSSKQRTTPPSVVVTLLPDPTTRRLERRKEKPDLYTIFCIDYRKRINFLNRLGIRSKYNTTNPLPPPLRTINLITVQSIPDPIDFLFTLSNCIGIVNTTQSDILGFNYCDGRRQPR